MVNSGDDGFIGLAPVGCYAPNAWGLFDLVGNVWELTADVYHPHHLQPAEAEHQAAHGVEPLEGELDSNEEEQEDDAEADDAQAEEHLAGDVFAGDFTFHF